MSNPQPSQQADAPRPGRAASDDSRRPVRSEAPSGPPPLDAPRPWRTEGLPRHGKDSEDQGSPRRNPKMWRFWILAGVLLIGLWGLLSWQDARNAPPTIPNEEIGRASCRERV